MKKDLTSFNDMIDRVFLELWKRKNRHVLKDEYFENFPIKIFNIAKIAISISKMKHLSNESINRAFAILSDLKMLFYFLLNILDYFYVGAAMIVGNSNYQDAGLNTISFLQGNHYKVYLISIVYERILDFLELINFDKLSDAKKNKWGKKYAKLSKVSGFDLISEAEHEKMINFKERIRRAEIHGFSSIIRQLYAEKWDHLQEEEDLIKTLLRRIADKYN